MAKLKSARVAIKIREPLVKEMSCLNIRKIRPGSPKAAKPESVITAHMMVSTTAARPSDDIDHKQHGCMTAAMEWSS